MFHMRQSPHCNEHYACACYSSEITRLGARLTEVEAELRKLRRIARVSPQSKCFKHRGTQRKILSRRLNQHDYFVRAARIYAL